MNRRLATAGAVLAVLLGLGCQREQTPPQPAEMGQESSLPRLPANATLEQALDFPDAFQRIERVAQILDAATPSQLPSIRAAFESAPLPWGDLEYTLFMDWWARFDPNEALGYCYGELRTRHPRTAAAVFRTWGRTDPQAALDSGWLNSMTGESAGLNPEFIDPLVVGWFESGKPGLDDFIQGLGTDLARAAALNAYMRMKILRDGSRPALEWAIAAPFTPDVQRLLLASGLNIVARREPNLAIEWMEIAEKQGMDARTFAARIGRGWATSSPHDAMEWVTKRDFAESAEFIRTVTDIADLWIERDEKGLQEWLKKQTSAGWTDLIRSQAIKHHVKIRNYRVDWADVISRSSELLNADLREKMYLWTVQRWKRVDPEPATQWIRENEELLGTSIEFVDQLPKDEFKRIDALQAKSEGTSDKS